MEKAKKANRIIHKSVKVRLTKEEYEQLLEKKTKARLTEWIREYCLGNELKKTKSIPKADPVLLIALSKIGGNMNQIARHLNQDKDLNVLKKIEYFTELASIEKAMQDLLNCFSNYKSH